jgi:hypothetical protein
MKTTTVLALFALFACVSAEGGELFADRREALQKVYGAAVPGGGYGPSPSPIPSPSPKHSPSPSPKPPTTPGPVVVTKRAIAKTTAKFAFTASNAVGVSATCHTLSPGAPAKTTVSVRSKRPAVGEIVATGLKPGTAYACVAHSTDGKREGPSSRIAFTTAPPPSTPPPAKPALKSVKPARNSAVVETTKPARATGYRANCNVKGVPQPIPNSVSASKTGLVVTLRNLKPRTDYTCRIYGVSSSGTGAALSVFFTTKK